MSVGRIPLGRQPTCTRLAPSAKAAFIISADLLDHPQSQSRCIPSFRLLQDIVAPHSLRLTLEAAVAAHVAIAHIIGIQQHDIRALRLRGGDCDSAGYCRNVLRGKRVLVIQPNGEAAKPWLKVSGSITKAARCPQMLLIQFFVCRTRKGW